MTCKKCNGNGYQLRTTVLFEKAMKVQEFQAARARPITDYPDRVTERAPCFVCAPVAYDAYAALLEIRGLEKRIRHQKNQGKTK